MKPDDLLEFTRKTPFCPFRIHVTDGRTYDVRHPDQMIVLRSRLVVGVGDRRGLPDHVEHLALAHIVRAEDIDTAA